MDIDGIHGLAHWKRVRENGLYLAKHTPGADADVIEAFAWVHDCCRKSESWDPNHGFRACQFAQEMLSTPAFEWVTPDQFSQLLYACELHDKGHISEDPTIACCWDADRLDLPRVMIEVDPGLLSTEHAKKASVIEWSRSRSLGGTGVFLSTADDENADVEEERDDGNQ